MSEATSALAFWDAARTAIEKAHSIDELSSIRDRAEAIRYTLKLAGEAPEVVRKAEEIKIRAERRAGEMIRELPKAPAGRPSNNRSEAETDSPATYAEQGIDKRDASKWQRIAEIPEDRFEAFIAKSPEITTAGALKLSRDISIDRRRDAMRSTSEEDTSGSGIHTGDLSLLDDLLEDDSVDLFFTDPPWNREAIIAYERLGEIAAKKLKPGGLVVTYSGHWYLPQYMDGLAKHLTYWWLFCIELTGTHGHILQRHISVAHRPVLVYVKEPIKNRYRWVDDFVKSDSADKRYHKWGQGITPALYWIERLTEPGDLVVDPFCGGGTVPMACKVVGRRCIATEINEETAAIARMRLRTEVFESDRVVSLPSEVTA